MGEDAELEHKVMSPYVVAFDRHFRQWVTAACGAWGYPPPEEVFYHRVRERLTDETLAWIGYGVEAGLIFEDGLKFNLIDNSVGKGPYQWFGRQRTAELQCHWEYFVQVAFFVRLWQPCRAAGFRLTFEDGLMDLAVRRNGELLWCIEVKEKRSQLERLLEKLASHGTGVDLGMPDRGNDSLRKAKYLVKHRPKFFTGIAINAERNFRVRYPESNEFSLVEDNPPVVALHRRPQGK